MCGRVSDARAGRAESVVVGAVGVVCGDSRVGCSGAGEPAEAGAGGFGAEAFIDQVAVAVVLLAVGPMSGIGRANGDGANNKGALHD